MKPMITKWMVASPVGFVVAFVAWVLMGRPSELGVLMMLAASSLVGVLVSVTPLMDRVEDWVIHMVKKTFERLR